MSIKLPSARPSGMYMKGRRTKGQNAAMRSGLIEVAAFWKSRDGMDTFIESLQQTESQGEGKRFL
jgi:Tfp pilus assembly protein PilN